MKRGMEFAIDKVQNFEDLFLDIKYEWLSFDWVMNISDLWHELVWLEYCLKTILLRLLKEDKKNVKSKILKKEISDINVADFEILTEGFVNNCFLKRIKFKKTNKIIDILDQIEKRPELNKYILALIVTWIWLYGTIYTSQLSADKEILKKSIEKWIVSNDVLINIKKSNLSPSSKNIALELIWDKKFRTESSKTVLPIKNENDYLELTSSAFQGTLDNKIRITHSDKDIFIASFLDNQEDNVDLVRFDLVEWRISSINLDANKNQIWFKVLNEWAEINCHLINSLKIADYKEGYLWEWVEIEWNITHDNKSTKYIEIHTITKIDTPISEAEQGTLN